MVKQMEIVRLPSGSKCIDSLLGGGFEAGTITQIYGASATGKTSLCLMLSYNTALNFGKVAFLDTEGLSWERVDQIFKDKTALRNLLVREVYDFRQQSIAVKELGKLCKKEEIRLIVVDSFTALYRSELEDERAIQVKRELIQQLTFLLGLARKHNLAVVITNQMFTDVKTGEDKPLGGPSLDHLSKIIISLEKFNSERKARLVKHRSKAEGSSCNFRITTKGIEP